MAKQGMARKDTMERVMHEFKHGELEMRGGLKVKSRRQAVAIGLREAGASKFASKKDNEGSLRCTKRKERRGQTARAEAEGRRNDPTSRGGSDSRAALYAEAKRRNIPGRSRMNRKELERALRR